jgi:DNA processing protein
MNIKKLTLKSHGFPEMLRDIPQPPRVLYHLGAPLAELLERPRVTIVGSRSASAYGRQVTLELAAQLAERGIVIVSGLALGIDAVAHQAALEAGGLALAVLPGPLDAVVPATNRGLAQAILDRGGALVSEYHSGSAPHKQNFIARNRLMAGLGQIVLITEAGEKSGAIHTANFALQQGKTVLAVPGNITNIGSVGTNNLIKSGAVPVTSYLDVLHALGFKADRTAGRTVRGRNAHEQLVLDLLQKGVSDGSQLLQHSKLSVSVFNQALTMLEISGKIRPLGANHWALR